ncbi:hypothetical protein LAG90_07195 [Marinilongibacter aquaticus]|uniref:hypothetical protein n=1 Tax=Marinilongibacter aquaticus TaxID=2975157 RepID=UPI0021BD38E4|nr:hypothetical protein [Marinilongibacter aquaticus]UBM60429.1 hypothetical protein LAG90_07195 [Marinilongibacter aquaticus]
MSRSTTSLFETTVGKSWQCDLTEKVFIAFKQYQFAVSVGELRKLKNRLIALDIDGMIFDLSDDCDFHSFDLPQFQTHIKLSLCELIQLRDLFEGTWFAIELIHMCHDILGDYRVQKA